MPQTKPETCYNPCSLVLPQLPENRTDGSSIGVTTVPRGIFMPFVKCSVDGCSRKLQPLLKVDPRDRDTWFYRECDVCFRPNHMKHSSKKLRVLLICDRCRREAEAQQRSADPESTSASNATLRTGISRRLKESAATGNALSRHGSIDEDERSDNS